MAKFAKQRLEKYLEIVSNDQSPAAKGKALEDLIAYIFNKIPGVDISHRNAVDYSKSQEIDLAFWNDKKANGFYFLPDIILVECKEWDIPVSSMHVQWFISKVEDRGLDFGILIAANGITGDHEELNSSRERIALALSKNRRLIVITRDDILCMKESKCLIRLIKGKITRLIANRCCI